MDTSRSLFQGNEPFCVHKRSGNARFKTSNMPEMYLYSVIKRW